MREIAFILIAIFIVSACAEEAKTPRANTPSAVARIWLENYYHNNDYKLAKSYSTAETANMIDTIKSMIFPDQESTENLPFEIKNVRCKQSKGELKAECTCTYEEAGASFTENLTLVKHNDQWLVNAIDSDDDLLKDDDIEKMTKDFEKSLDRLLEK